MRTAVVALSTLAVALAATCGQTPVKPVLTPVGTEKAAAGRPGRYIVGGELAEPYSWPWMAVFCGIDWANADFCPLLCAATVVSEKWLLVRASCLYGDSNPWNYKVKFGVFDDYNAHEAGEQTIPARYFFLHPNYNHDTQENDIALVELKSEITFTDHVQPVCLPKTDDVALSGTKDLWMTGWGVTTPDGFWNVVGLHQANVPIIDSDTCAKQYPKDFHKEIEFCAGKKGVDSCAGDGGNPLVQQAAKSGSWFEYGITSWGLGCTGDFAGVYTRVSAYCDWINTTTNGTVQCQDVL